MKRVLFLALLLPAVGCTTTRIVTTGEMATMAPMLSVERFLQASNQRDLHAMASLFGDADGPVIETGSTLGCAFKKMGSWIGIGERCRTLQEVEIWMDTLAQILQHQNYTLASDSRVPGRVHPTTRIGVDLVVDGRDIRDVPFLVVQTKQGRWLVEEIDLEKITG